MSKKNVKAGKRTESGVNANFNFVAVVRIKNKKVSTSDTLTTFPLGPVVWKIENQDNATYKVSIDYTKIIHKGHGGKHEHPFPKDETVTTDVANGSTAAIVALLQDYKPSSTDSYKYTVDLIQGNILVDTLDPDLDVVPPGSIVTG